ncbi:hypothetical protein Csa_015832 [Cucumis sativus]|uniref:Transmembrane protein n=1 Tax=Cucumis sativus TaxID=3659 RepID=A0A0A0KB86_CUCSA|nr:hypothetical protein Csa_015832 [Cucumis sativus]
MVNEREIISPLLYHHHHHSLSFLSSFSLIPIIFPNSSSLLTLVPFSNNDPLFSFPLLVPILLSILPLFSFPSLLFFSAFLHLGLSLFPVGFLGSTISWWWCCSFFARGVEIITYYCYS